MGFGFRFLAITLLLLIVLVGCEQEKKDEPDFESNESSFIARMIGPYTFEEIEFYGAKAYYYKNVYYFVGEYTLNDSDVDYKVLYIIKQGEVTRSFPIKNEETAMELHPSEYYNYQIAVNEGIFKEYTKSDLEKIAEKVLGTNND